MNEEKKELENKFKGGGEDIVYEHLESGSHIMGCVEIKSVELPTWTKRDGKFVKNKEVLQDGYRFVFRSYLTPNAYVSVNVTATTGPRGNCYKLLNNMLDGNLDKEQTAESMFAAMVSVLGKWFKVKVEKRPFTNKDGEEDFWVNVVDNRAMPLEDQKIVALGDCREYFKTIDGPAGEQKEAQEALSNASNPLTYYNIRSLDGENLAAALNILKFSNAEQVYPNGPYWASSTVIGPLAKFICSQDEAEDFIPF